MPLYSEASESGSVLKTPGSFPRGRCSGYHGRDDFSPRLFLYKLGLWGLRCTIVPARVYTAVSKPEVLLVVN